VPFSFIPVTWTRRKGAHRVLSGVGPGHYRCTTNACDPYTGTCTFKPIAGCCKGDVDCKHADPCQEGKCNAGKCEYKPKVCDDGNKCTIDKCENGICKYVAKACDDNNKCTKDSCDDKTGNCVYKPTVCEDGDK
jgi:hypothetical protein